MPCNSFSFQLTFWATSCWTPNATSLPSNTTWLSLFRSFWLKSPTFLPCHVLLDLHRDITTFQYDVALAFSPFLPQITRFLAEPCRVGLPTGHRYLPIRRGSRFSSLFTSNYSLSYRATSRWTSIATWLPSNTTRCPLLHQKTTRAIRVVARLLYLNSKVQSSLKLDSSKRCSGRRRGPHELEPMPACL